MNSTSSLLEKLSKINDENTLKIFVPSIGKAVAFKSLNIKQQKNLIKTALDGAASGASLNQVLNQIIVENSTEQIDFKIYDRYAIIVALRIAIVGEEIENKGTKISLTDLLNKKIAEFKDLLSIETSKDIEYHGINVELELPTLSRDIAVNEKFIKISKASESNLGNAIGDLYVYEIVKFIKTLRIEGDEEVHQFDKIAVKDCVSIVEALPQTLNNMIIEFIEGVRSIENSFIETEDGSIEINAAFFTKA